MLFTGYYTGSVNSLLGTSIKTGLCLLSSYYNVNEGYIWKQQLPLHRVVSSLLTLFWFGFLLQHICSPSCTIMSFLFKFKKHDQWFNIQSFICQTSCLLSVLDKMIQPLRISWKYFCLNNLIPAALKISSTSSVVLRSWAARVRFEHQLQSFQSDWQHSAGQVFRS